MTPVIPDFEYQKITVAPGVVLHAAVGPVLGAPEDEVVHIDFGDLSAGFLTVVVAAVLAVTDPAVVQAVEAEGVHVGVLRQDLGQHVDEEIAVGPQEA